MKQIRNTNGLPVAIVLLATIAVAVSFIKHQIKTEAPIPIPELPGKVWLGQKAPPIVVKDEQNQDVNLGRVMGKKPVILLFYSGISDIYSQGQIIMSLPYEQQFATHGATIYLIAMGSVKVERDAFYSVLTMRKIKRPGNVFQFVSDPMGAAASNYAGSITATNSNEKTRLRRATFAIGKNSIIKYAYITLSKKTVDNVDTLMTSVQEISAELKSVDPKETIKKAEFKSI